MKLLLFIMLIFSSQVFAQVVDMRAFSRQRGYRAYQSKQVSASPSVRSYPVQRQAAASSENRAERQSVPENSVSGNSIPEYHDREIPVPEKDSVDSDDMKMLRQTGVKIFQEQDEEKVMNFVVENPEFKKLNKKQQQDLLNRIKYEKEKVESGKP